MHTHGALQITVFNDPGYMENGYLCWDERTRAAWMVDPGYPPQAEQFLAALQQYELTPAAILLTHGHLDHIAGVEALKAALPQVPLVVPQGEAHMLTDAQANLSLFLGAPIEAPAADRLLAPGETLELGQLRWEARDVRGHSPGGLAYYCAGAGAGVVLVGDALFSSGIGRTDFPGSSYETLLANIRKNLMSLPDATVVYAGHGPPTTIGRERKTNPFLTGMMELD